MKQNNILKYYEDRENFKKFAEIEKTSSPSGVIIGGFINMYPPHQRTALRKTIDYWEVLKLIEISNNGGILKGKLTEKGERYYIKLK